MPPIPPMPPAPIPIAFSSFGSSTTTASAVVSSDDTLAASINAVRTTYITHSQLFLYTAFVVEMGNGREVGSIFLKAHPVY